MAKKKSRDNVIQFRIESVKNILDKTIKYGITYIYDLDSFVPYYRGFGGVGDMIKERTGIQEIELPPHTRDLQAGYLFETKEDAQVALEKLIEKVKEKMSNVETEII